MVTVRHQLRQEFKIVFYFSGECLTNAARLPGDVGAKGREHATGAGCVAMSARQISVHDRGERSLSRVAFQRSLPEAFPPSQRETNCLGRDNLLRTELAV